MTREEQFAYAPKPAAPEPVAAPPQPAAPAPAPAEPPAAVVEPKPPKPTASDGIHPLAISPEEGMLAAPQEEVVAQLNKVLQAKYAAMVLYTNYGARLMAHWRDSVADHFDDHFKDEKKQAYEVVRKITAMGGIATPKVSRLADVDDMHAMLMALMAAEKALLAAERKVIEMAGENIGLRVQAEEWLVTDSHHLDDMRRLLYCENFPVT